MMVATLAERKDVVELLMEFAVPRTEIAAALCLLEKYQNDVVALNIFHSFYSHLPEGTDDRITGLKLVARKQGAFLIVAVTTLKEYLYMATREDAVFWGRVSDGLSDHELLDFFGFTDQEGLFAKVGDLASLDPYEPAHQDAELCPLCFVAVGECHVLGCPVEVCPWCDGQLTHCQCRFAKLGLEHLETAEDIEALLDRLSEVGRIAFAPEQRPAYPSFGEEEENM